MAAPVSIKDLGIERLKADAERLKRERVTIGYQGASGRARHPNADTSVAQVAAWQEFGTPGSDDRKHDQPRAMIPSRPFMRETFMRHRAEAMDMIKQGLRDLIAGSATVEQIQQRIGEFLVAKARATIDDSPSWATPLADSTVDRKGHDHPLIETGTMRDAVSWAARDGDKIVRSGDP